MKKWFSMGSAMLLIAVLLLIPVAVSAAPAPPLTGVTIRGVTSDGNNYVFNNEPLSGSQGVIAVYLKGTIRPNSLKISQQGVTIPTSQFAPTEYITDSGNIVIGEIRYLSFDLNDVSTGTLTASAENYITPYTSYAGFKAIVVQ